jgi:predicted CXXCH cytochrome family protein
MKCLIDSCAARLALITCCLLAVFLPAEAANPPVAGQKPAVTKPADTLSMTRDPRRVSSGQKFFGDAKFVGAESCKTCHAKQYEEWRETWHAKMERWPSPETVVGDFNNRTIDWKNIRIRDKDGKESRISPSGVTSRMGDKFLFTLIDKDNPANNQTYEVAKVLGGKWDQGYEIKLGDNFLPAPIRWSVSGKDWLIGGFRVDEWFVADGTPDGRPRRQEELPLGRVAEAKCNGCHTTGFEFVKDKASNVWKGIGNGELGIACEKCHGPGDRHVQEAAKAREAGTALKPEETTIVHPLKDLNALQQTEVCGQCHGRSTNKTTPELSFPIGFLPGDVDMTSRSRFWSHSGTNNPDEYAYFWPNDWASRNRQQWQDYSKSAHFNKAGMSCLTCHTFHGKQEEAQLRQKPAELCGTCHSETGHAKRGNAEMYAGSPMQKAGVQCVDCHMAKIGSRTRATSKAGHQWDTSSHTFMVALPAMEKNQSIRSSCAGCHEGQGKKMPAGAQTPPFDANVLDIILKQKQSGTRAEIEEVEKLLAKVNMRNVRARELADAARGKLNFVLLDGSMGFHNQEKAMEHIQAAKKMAQNAAKLK